MNSHDRTIPVIFKINILKFFRVKLTHLSWSAVNNPARKNLNNVPLSTRRSAIVGILSKPFVSAEWWIAEDNCIASPSPSLKTLHLNMFIVIDAKNNRCTPSRSLIAAQWALYSPLLWYLEADSLIGCPLPSWVLEAWFRPSCPELSSAPDNPSFSPRVGFLHHCAPGHPDRWRLFVFIPSMPLYISLIPPES